MEKKLDELIDLLADSELDSESISSLQGRFNQAVENKKISLDELEKFQVLGEGSRSRLDLANDLELLLSQSNINSENVKDLRVAERSRKLITLILGVILIALGFAMIVMPAPPYFEMFTIFYFTRDDGVTLMDLIALIVVFSGVYVCFTSLSRSKN